MLPLPILPTKLYIPRYRSETVIRNRLLKTIDDNFKSKIILVAAPAGFGKTTLICNWIRQTDKPVAWFSISEVDNDPSTFLSYVLAALQTIDSRIGQSTLPILQSSHPDHEGVLTSLIRDIFHGGKEMVLVLEDYHVIKEPQIHSLVEFLIRHKPGHLHLVITSRSDPLLPLHRYRANNQLTEIRAGNLSFSDEEAYAFFNKVMGLKLTTENVTDLNQRTEGWITGLQMAALSLKSHENINGFIQSFKGDNRYIMDYLLEEVINVQTNRVKSFLLQTSILERFSSHLSEAVTGIDKCQELIDTLDRENLFLISLDSNKLWYRYHHLFSDLLRKKLGDTQPELVPVLHKNASKWFAANDFIPEALRHSILAKDWLNASILIETTFMNRMNRGEDFATMLDRLKALPEELICSRPSLCIMYAWMYSLNLQLDEAESYLQHVENMEGEKLDADLCIQIEVIRAEMARNRGDLRDSIKSSLEILDKITSHPSSSHVQIQNYTATTMSLAWAYLLKGEMERAHQKFRDSLRISNEIGSLTLILIHRKGMAQSYRLQGRLKSAGKVLEEALKNVKESAGFQRQLPSAAAFIYLEYGNYLRELNQLREAEGYIRRGLELGIDRRIDGFSLQDGFVYLARIKHGQHDLPASVRAFQDADLHLAQFDEIKDFRELRDIWKATLSILSMMAGREEIDLEEIRVLEDWISKQEFTPRPAINSLREELRYLFWARWYLHKDQHGQALQLLDHLFIQADISGRTERIITIRILQAVAYNALGDLQKSLQSLCKAIDICEPEGYYCRIFVDEGSDVLALLKKLTSHEVLDEKGNPIPVPLTYVQKLILSFEVINEEVSFTALPDPLSEREKDVLLMLSAGLSNKNIAEKLFISIDTVKSHLKKINVKLSTGNRKQAVERARELGLL